MRGTLSRRHRPSSTEASSSASCRPTTDTSLSESTRLVLPAPVLFIGGRHGLQAPSPAWSELDREASLNILADAIVANPAFRDPLLRLATELAAP